MGASGARDSTAAYGADHGEEAVPLQPVEVCGGAEIHQQPVKDLTLK